MKHACILCIFFLDLLFEKSLLCLAIHLILPFFIQFTQLSSFYVYHSISQDIWVHEWGTQIVILIVIMMNMNTHMQYNTGIWTRTDGDSSHPSFLPNQKGILFFLLSHLKTHHHHPPHKINHTSVFFLVVPFITFSLGLKSRSLPPPYLPVVLFCNAV